MATQTYTQIELLSANGSVLRRVSTAPPRLPTDDEIPIIDLAPIDGTLDERKALASRIKTASENTGFFYIRNHGIPEELIQNSLSQAKTFFDQPLSEKMKIDSSASNVSSGYYGVGTRKLVRIFALALGEREDYFDDVTSHPGADALYIHYPGIPDVAADSDIDVGIGSHTDIQCFTLLWQDNSGGLQVLSAQDEWLDARPIEGTLVVNIGDFLQRLSNNKFKSTVHRVYNRQPDSRYSMPFFFGFNPEAVCKVVPSCVDDEHPPLYEPISCGEVCS
ncbi:isopenicillin N [Aspergillus oryzae 100-8]|uniref:Isopenicillin N synthase n=1 Tax=Aspergillus oryzae (strain 3.042) TaxID=1160506 RepID=I8TMR7_ASPO3|nr:isopenicillin N synthase [Aspergillus oryzae 3.042]KDE84295.1 isopenicillin N [Aspergillus oryzae 100-8]|eukprot:EIT75475.1 isopenicillin N synthase [Aspergillus oryzae 3.042]